MPIVIWLTILLHEVEHKEQDKEPSQPDWPSLWLDEGILRAGINLRSIVWVDFIHDRLGEAIFEAAKVRLGRAAAFVGYNEVSGNEGECIHK